MLSFRDEKSTFPPDGLFARIISRVNQEMKSQASYKPRYALLAKGGRLATLKRSPIESSDLKDSFPEDKPVNYLLLCFFLVVASGLSRRGKDTCHPRKKDFPKLENLGRNMVSAP